MAYGYFTDKYSLPAQVKGDIMSEREEKRKNRIIDNNLYAAILLHSAGYGVISEGTYSGTFSANNSRVDLTALEALISQIYVSPTSTLSWTGIPNNVTFYLYATLVEQATDTSPEGASSREYKSVSATTNTTGVIPSNSILLATATTTASTITINTNPTGKRMIVTVANHDLHGSGVDAYNDATFRGDVSIQDTLTVEDPSTFQKTLTASRELQITGGIESGLNVYGGDTIIRDDLIVQKTTVVNDDTTLEYLQVRSGEDIYGNATFRDNVTIQGTLTVLNDTTLESLLVKSGAEIYGNSTTHGDLTITADLVVRGNNNEVYISAGSGLDIGFYDAQGTKIAFMDGGGNLYLHGQTYNSAF